MEAQKNNCYKCPYRGEVPGSVHSTCSFFTGKLQKMLTLLSMIGDMPGIKDDTNGQDLISFHPHGVEKGWCTWPFDFDPVWVTCNLPIETTESREK